MFERRLILPRNQMLAKTEPKDLTSKFRGLRRDNQVISVRGWDRSTFVRMCGQSLNGSQKKIELRWKELR